VVLDMRVARWYCPRAQVTFSLLPDFAASRLSGTLERWDKAGKLRAKRHPMNGYRLYPRRQVLELRRQIHSGSENAS
jgi:hypothetical protein